ncbi:MAG: DUF881 domain-containing protein [Bacillota bacterium]
MRFHFKLNVWYFNLLILSILLGFLLSLQIKSVRGDYQYVPLKIVHDYNISLESERKEIENLRSVIRERHNQIIEYEQLKDEGGLFIEKIKEDLAYQKLIGGFTDVRGDGVIVTLNDEVRELYEGENVNNIIVHDIDVLTIINDLKVAGAEAIAINGQRLLSHSEINCAGNTIQINRQRFAQPFVIKAIGDPKTLEAAINAPGTYAHRLRELELILINVNTVKDLTIPKYSEELNFRYLNVVEEGE